MDLSIASDTINYLFASATANTQAKMDSLAATILGQGIDFFQNKEYEKAADRFKQAAALSPSSDNSASAYNYLGIAYINLEDTDKAIKTYKEAIRLYPADENFHTALGDIYLQEKMYKEALEQYEAAVNLNSNDAEARYSLGQSYITAGKLEKAGKQFKEVVRISPDNASGYYGMGQVARAEGDLTVAVNQLTKAIRKDKNFELAYVELGYAYADQGNLEKANEQLSVLENESSDYAAKLGNYITQSTQPRIIAAVSTDGFNTSLGPKTNVSHLSSILADTNKSKLFSLNITFSKEMDVASIINPYNWKISRATIQDNGGVYNYGITPSSKEAFILPSPAYVSYNTETNTATVHFRVSQNVTSNATIDPNHIVFKFSGVDIYGKTMDTSADEYGGFSSIA
ncbi:MAG: tetratricopeptide repeat protein [Smithella sp.]